MHTTDERLQDFLDGTLSAARAADVEAHLLECHACASSLASLRALLEGAAALPRSIQPRRDLLPGIHAALEAHDHGAASARPAPRDLTAWRYPLAAAALVLIALASTISLISMRAGGTNGSSVNAVATGLAPAEFSAVEARYVTATSELQRLLDAEGDALSPETLRLLEENLAIIDRALSESRAALAADPANQTLPRMIVAAYEQKLDLLRRASDLDSRFVPGGGI